MLSDTNNNDVFAFMKCPDKFKKLTNTNNLLNINNNNHNKNKTVNLVFLILL